MEDAQSGRCRQSWIPSVEEAFAVVVSLFDVEDLVLCELMREEIEGRKDRSGESRWEKEEPEKARLVSKYW